MKKRTNLRSLSFLALAVTAVLFSCKSKETTTETTVTTDTVAVDTTTVPTPPATDVPADTTAVPEEMR